MASQVGKKTPTLYKILSEVFIIEGVESIGVQVTPCLTEDWWEPWGTELLSYK